MSVSHAQQRLHLILPAEQVIKTHTPSGRQFDLWQRLRWYCHVRYWRQAVAAASVYGGAFAIWLFVVR